jgi:hypothetical protein
MSPSEVGWRIADHTRRSMWSHRRLSSGALTPPISEPRTDGWHIAPAGKLSELAPEATIGILRVADQLLLGEWEQLGVWRFDMVDPDWSADPAGGPGFPSDTDSFRIDYRSGTYGNVKQVWELSRHHHVTVLACAWRLTGDDRYAELADRHLRSWWRENRFLRGVNWASGIELGVRLISWVWARRLLDGWSGVEQLFEKNDDAIHQVYWHQRWLAAFPSRGSSANNHVIAELAGQLVASCAFDWFDESARWRSRSLAALSEALVKNTFASGVNRELATDYHGFVAELGLLAVIEAEAAGSSVPAETWNLLCQMVDVAAAFLDAGLRAPRQGDSDDGRALVVADPSDNRWRSILAIGASVFGPLSWWPPIGDDLTGAIVSGLVGHPVTVEGRPRRRPQHFPDAGIAILRSDLLPDGHETDQIWCRCDGGPHGFGSLAAHGHADALSIEVRIGGVDLLADPGTYCYHEEPEWRHYFRSTRSHNTVSLDYQDQSASGGPFMWSRHAQTRVLEFANIGSHQRWSAEHDGYRRLDSSARHRRTVTLDAQTGQIEILDQIEASGTHRLNATFQLGPTIHVHLVDQVAALEWPTPAGLVAHADLLLPADLSWTLHRGEEDPIVGWYSPSFGTKVPAYALVGTGIVGAVELQTRLTFGHSS